MQQVDSRRRGRERRRAHVEGHVRDVPAGGDGGVHLRRVGEPALLRCGGELHREPGARFAKLETLSISSDLK